MNILYPYSRQFGDLDRVASHIVNRLKSCNWEVPGIEIDFASSGSYRWVREVKGPDYVLTYGRKQGLLPNDQSNFAAVSEICIPQRELKLFADESGPRLITYVGDDWEADKDWWYNGKKSNSKLNGERRRYLVYRGSTETSLYLRFPNKRSAYLVQDIDMDREYQAQGDEPEYFLTSDVLQETYFWLGENVLVPLQA